MVLTLHNMCVLYIWSTVLAMRIMCVYMCILQYYYSIKDVSIGGRCVCNGHADSCDLTAFLSLLLCVYSPRNAHCVCVYSI